MSLLAAVRVRFPDFLLDIEFSAPEGSFVSLLGPSGCGKTTALRALAGLQIAERLRLSIGGEDFAALPPQRREIGFVFQDYALFPHLTVHDNVAYGPRMRKWDNGAVERAVEEKLELVDLTGYGPRRIGELSGGERQRVAVARALAPDPKLLFLDEPLSALDRQLRQRLRRDLKRIQHELGITTLYVTHDQEEALSLSDILVIMRDGAAVEKGPPDVLYRTPETIFTAGFLGAANLLTPESGDGTAYRRAAEIIDSRVKASDSCVPIFFRPEDARIEDDENSGALTLEGTVRVTEYLGDSSYIEADCESAGRITVKTLGYFSGSEKSPIRFTVPASSLKPLRG
ncbi:MAG: ABC transporter ATP-binding protein [Spirochaetia bacterium]